jgi:DNA-binding MarR family transcriptional regulator
MGIFNRVQKEIDARDKQEGITPADLLDLSPLLRRLMNRITRQGEITIEGAAEHLGETLDNTRQMLNTLVEKGYLEREEREDGWVYRTRFARKRGRDIPAGIWSALGQRTKDE